MIDGALPWRAEADALVVAIRLTPKGGRDAIDGIETLSDGRRVLKARVRSVPEDGQANAALLKLIAKACGVPPSRVALTSGATSRLKTVRIEADPLAAAASLAASPGLAGGA